MKTALLIASGLAIGSVFTWALHRWKTVILRDEIGYLLEEIGELNNEIDYLRFAIREHEESLREYER